jgi:tetraacyldisaccharide 4'-kinase
MIVSAHRAPEIRLRRVWEDRPSPVVAALLSALAAGYRGVLAIRRWGYVLGVARTRRLACPVISVGNVTLGGSGKTPLVELAVRTLRDLGERPAIVSRGYGRQSRGVLVVADGAGIHVPARLAGDEPSLLASRLPGIPVVVGESRWEAARAARDACGAGVIVLDDGFQHLSLAKDLEIVAVNGRAPWGNARLFPRGALREPLRALRRADLVVVTNPRAAAEVQSVVETLRGQAVRADVVTASYVVTGVFRAGAGTPPGPATLSGRRLLAFAGLAAPRGFADTLASAGAHVADLVEFPDHYWYRPEDLAEVAARARRAGCDGIVTTEKDWMRLDGLPLPTVPLWVVQVSARIDANEEAWRHALTRTVRRRAA